MKILYDHQIFSFHKFGGISRYFAQIIDHLPEDAQASIAIKYSDNVYLKQKLLVDGLLPLNHIYNTFLFGWKFKGKGGILNQLKKIHPEKYDAGYCNKQLSIELLKKQAFDIFQPTYYEDYFLEYIGNKPFVLTIHDMIHEIYPEIQKEEITAVQKENLVKKAAHIIAVSENTKKDIIDIYNISEKTISVIYHANSLTNRQEAELNLPQKYFLYVGARGNYKNFLFFARAIAPLLKQLKDTYVICTGSAFSPTEIQFLDSLNIRKYFIHIFVEEKAFPEIYNKAIAFVFPSYYEGFGIPILEAFGSSCPVLLSDSSCFPEIAKDCALYFPPKDIQQMRRCLNEVIDNPSLRQSLIDKGNVRVKDFSWSEFANQTYAVYKRVLKNE
jgi:glycosyltransferase involved in cell wall biosynthesis